MAPLLLLPLPLAESRWDNPILADAQGRVKTRTLPVRFDAACGGWIRHRPS